MGSRSTLRNLSNQNETQLGELKSRAREHRSQIVANYYIDTDSREAIVQRKKCSDFF